jgi:hypothetical protein
MNGIRNLYLGSAGMFALAAMVAFAKASEGAADVSADYTELIRQASTLLNKDIDKDWTEDGRPSLAAIRKAAKDSSITQEALDAALPDMRRPEREAERVLAVEKKLEEDDKRPRLNQVRVVATERGYYGGAIREPGDSFVFTGIPGVWMRPETAEEKKLRNVAEAEQTAKAKNPDRSGADVWAAEIAKPTSK